MKNVDRDAHSILEGIFQHVNIYTFRCLVLGPHKRLKKARVTLKKSLPAAGVAELTISRMMISDFLLISIFRLRAGISPLTAVTDF